MKDRQKHMAAVKENKETCALVLKIHFHFAV